MRMPEPNVVVSVDRRGRASVEVGGVKMVGVVAVSGDHRIDEAVVTIEVIGRYVAYEQKSSSVDAAIGQAMRQIDYALKAKVRDDRDRRQLEEENENLRRQLAERPRYRVPCGRGGTDGAD